MCGSASVTKKDRGGASHSGARRSAGLPMTAFGGGESYYCALRGFSEKPLKKRLLFSGKRCRIKPISNFSFSNSQYASVVKWI